MINRIVATAILMTGLSYATIAKAQDDQADLGLWQTVQRSNTPADYQLYLQIFPNGRFAPLARLRAQGAGAGIAQAAPAPQEDPDAPQLTVTPTVGRVGQQFTVTCGTLPSGGRFDAIVAVPAGSPPAPPSGLTQGIQMDYVANCFGPNSSGKVVLGPLPPGRWEFRWMTTLYNLENRFEMKAKVEVTVR